MRPVSEGAFEWYNMNLNIAEIIWNEGVLEYNGIFPLHFRIIILNYFATFYECERNSPFLSFPLFNTF